MTQIDGIISCKRCNSDCCYKTEVSQDVNNFFCMGCGFQTTTMLKKDTPLFKEQMEILPALYKNLAGEDEDGLVWVPSYVNILDKGMVFMNGKNAEEAKWAAIKAVPVKEEEKEKFKKKDGTYIPYKMDMSSMKEFEENNFMDALSYIEVLPK